MFNIEYTQKIPNDEAALCCKPQTKKKETTTSTENPNRQKLQIFKE